MNRVLPGRFAHLTVNRTAREGCPVGPLLLSELYPIQGAATLQLHAPACQQTPLIVVFCSDDARMDNIYDRHVCDAHIARINRLHADTKPLWGKMNAGQMLAHVSKP
jgi:hypothetical protein